MFTKQIDRVAIVGSSHGNELLGIYLVKKYQLYPKLVKRTTHSKYSGFSQSLQSKAGYTYYF